MAHEAVKSLYEILKKYKGPMAVTHLFPNQQEAGRRWRFGDCEFIEVRRELLVRGVPVKLESKPLEVLQHLLEHPAQVLTKDELIGAAWATSTTDQSLTTAIAKLRKAFDGPRDSVILSVSGVGYRMAVPVACEVVDAPPPQLRLHPGDAVPGRPNWKLVKSLASSGPHSVWLAEHAKTREARVFKFATDGVRLRALQREVTLSRLFRKALGDDAGFVRILDWDFEREPFFIESEYCGQNLFEWSETEEFANLPASQRVAIVAQIAQTVAAAHALGILHNDLKPANVLIAVGPEDVTERAGAEPASPKLWQIKVVDFGVASVTDVQRLIDLQITHYGSFENATSPDGDSTPAGTAMYRAPEMLAGAAPSIQGDVYALGVMLYQIMCGDFLEAPSVGWESRIPDPVLRKDIADAANIDPGRRIASVSELAARLRTLEARHTEMELRAAERVAAEQARRSLENARLRRPWLIFALGALIVGLSASLWFASRAERARKAAEADAAHARRVEQFTQSLFTAGDDRVASKDITVEMLLARGVKRARALDNDRPEQADLLQIIGTVYDSLGSFDLAEDLLQSALKEQEQISGTDSPEFAKVLLAFSVLRADQGRGKDALDFAQRAYKIDARALPPGDPQVLDAEVKVGSALNGLGEYKRAVPVLEAVVQEERGQPDRLADLSEAIGILSNAESYLGNRTESLHLNEEALAIDRQRLGDKHPDVAADLINLSQLERLNGDYAKAEADGREALAIYHGWLPPGHYEIASAETTLSDALIYSGKVLEAMPLLSDALATQQAQFPGPDERTAHTLLSLGHAEQILRRLDVALTYDQKAEAQYRSLFPQKDYRLATALYTEGKIYQEQRRMSRAEAVLREALSIDTERLPAKDKRLLDIRLLLGEVLLAEHQPAAAQPLLIVSYRDASACGAACTEERNRADKAVQTLGVAAQPSTLENHP
jgi:serine/threonine protein kinase/DNA-binding winged helix-turn-helix (wHTH) protein